MGKELFMISACATLLLFYFQEKMDKLDLFRGDTVLLKSLQETETCCVIMMNDTLTDDKIQMNRCLRNNLGVKIGDVVRYFHAVPL